MKKTSKTTKTSGRVIFFGNERIATGVTTSAPTLQALIEHGYEVAAVISNYEEGRSRNSRQLEIKQVADRYDIPVLLPEKPADMLGHIRSFGAQIGVLVAYGRIVPQDIIETLPGGIVNIHPSLLPLHRGSTPIESVILNGEHKTGVSLMSLVKAMDAGPVYAQSEVMLDGTESKQELADSLLDIGTTMLIELLPGILDSRIVPLPQDETRATYDNLLSKGDGVIDWHKPAKRIEREVRAFMGWPSSRTTIAGKDVIVTQAQAVNTNHTEATKPGRIDTVKEPGIITVECEKGYLRIQRLKPAGKKEMSVEAFLAGYRHLLESA